MNNACTLDYIDSRQVVDRFRDIIDMGPMLEMDVNAELVSLRARLRKEGWDDDHICSFQAQAVSTSMWQERVPRCSERAGDLRAYEDWKFRSR